MHLEGLAADRLSQSLSKSQGGDEIDPGYKKPQLTASDRSKRITGSQNRATAPGHFVFEERNPLEAVDVFEGTSPIDLGNQECDRGTLWSELRQLRLDNVKKAIHFRPRRRPRFSDGMQQHRECSSCSLEEQQGSYLSNSPRFPAMGLTQFGLLSRRTAWSAPRVDFGARPAYETTMSDVSHALFDTTIGPCGVAWSDHGIVRIQLPEATRARTVARLMEEGEGTLTKPPASIARAIEQIQKHLEGTMQRFDDIELDMEGEPPFWKRVYRAARKVPAGRTLSYGELAARAGSKNAARAVGQALAKNPFAIVVPCHRVLGSHGAIGGFSAHGGTGVKQRLLAIEGAHSAR